MQQTLIAYYGQKPQALLQLVENCRHMLLGSAVGSFFRPYTDGQMHATLIGLESVVIREVRYNYNLCMQYHQSRALEYSAMESVLRQFFPIQIRLGGYAPSYAEFTSRGQLPYERSFRIDVPNRRVLLMGWPLDGITPSNALREFRRAMEQQCQVAHKYPNDNDWYMVLGELDAGIEGIPAQELQETETALRNILYQNPVELTIDLGDIRIATYADLRLPEGSTSSEPILNYLHNLQK